MTQIAALETQHKDTLDDDAYRRLTAVRAKLQLCLTAKIQFQFRLAQKAFYEHANKCSKMLARALRAK
ncbi:Hypothetical predicted protein [Pelobates cultripes]|uniref:Uncharacterized protein n=1 Tax=Pelobates cultripes TaxID=61616 RepID=A0AAD1S9D7_PELCU|nr:Hypothetical predicted protein [Pelobates cultripes]